MVNQLVFLIWCFLPTVWLFGMKFMCPEEFRDGMNTVICTINKTAIKDAECSSLQPSVTFHLTVNSFRTMICHTPHLDFSVCAKEQNAGGCWCNRSDGETYDYIFSYTANHTQDVGAKLECELCALPAKYLDEQISNSCRSLNFAKSSQSIDDNSTHDNQVNKSEGIVTAITTTTIIVIIAIATVVVVVCFRKQNSQKEKNESNGKTTYSPKGNGEEKEKIKIVISDDIET